MICRTKQHRYIYRFKEIGPLSNHIIFCIHGNNQWEAHWCAVSVPLNLIKQNRKTEKRKRFDKMGNITYITLIDPKGFTTVYPKVFL